MNSLPVKWFIKKTQEVINEIKKEFEQSDIAFFLPYQLELLPQKISDLFINISSFHEMHPHQIELYFQCIDHLISKYVYIKQWKKEKITSISKKLCYM